MDRMQLERQQISTASERSHRWKKGAEMDARLRGINFSPADGPFLTVEFKEQCDVYPLGLALGVNENH
ncbi:hypothetical protein Y032_0685g1519 [Ancylostoma ceylanicum]|uniref:Uncharacterized protein n=1 Tax=Ancylostoma ceylanicum TaxID=53326 RepID=A0A016WGK4_9BILA|nr:hypothetical protein Y032_0685g1519 [Ancylostoma ceylanicum]